MPISSFLPFFFFFVLKANHKEFNVMKNCCSLLLAVEEDEFAEIDREMWCKEDVDPPNVRFDLNKTRTMSAE